MTRGGSSEHARSILVGPALIRCVDRRKSARGELGQIAETNDGRRAGQHDGGVGISKVLLAPLVPRPGEQLGVQRHRIHEQDRFERWHLLIPRQFQVEVIDGG